MFSALFPADWEKFCFQEIQKDQMKNFINAQSTNMIGNQQAKNYIDVSVNYSDKIYLDQWLGNITTEKSEGVQPGVLAAVKEEHRDCRVALAGAKVAKTIFFHPEARSRGYRLQEEEEEEEEEGCCQGCPRGHPVHRSRS